MTSGHPVAQVQRAEQRREHSHLEAGELLGANLKLVAPLLRQEQGTDQVLEDDQHQAEQGHGLHPHLHVRERDPEREHRRGKLGGQQRHQRAAYLGGEPAALEVADVGGDHREVERQRHREEPEDEEVEGGVGLDHAGAVDGRVEGRA